MAKIFVVGSGSWGTAMTVSLASVGNRVCLWSFEPEITSALIKDGENKRFLPGVKIVGDVEYTSDDSKCTESEIVVLATPSHTIRSVAKRFREYINEKQTIVCISKGFDEEKHIRLTEVIKEEIPHATVVAMSGPSHAEEVSRALPTTNVVAGENKKAVQLIQDTFNTPAFRIYTSDDIIGVELGGALKNVIALAAGVCDGLGFGDNTKAALITRGIAEITRLGIAMGAKAETFAGLSGIGDLIVTCTSMHSRNRRAGILIGQGKTPDEAAREVNMVVEGIKTAKAVHYLSEKYGVEMPISNEVYNVIFEGRDVKECAASLMGRSLKSETYFS